MAEKMARENHKLATVFLLAAVLYMVGISMFSYSFEQGPNNRNVSVDTRVNITESLPQILSVIVDGGEGNITLVAGGARFVACNATVRDYNGGATVSGANATLFYNATDQWNSPDDNNTHYSNSSCAITGTDGYFRNFSCGFQVLYYANSGGWTCNVSVQDDYGFNDTKDNVTFIDPLLALNVTTLIDYGDLAVGDVSNPQEANVTNLGNKNINVSVRGYGGQQDDGLSFVCQIGNISIEYEKFNTTNNGVDVNGYSNLSSGFAQIPDLTVLQQTNDAQQEINQTYWILEVPPNPFGQCNGTVIFQAEAS